MDLPPLSPPKVNSRVPKKHIGNKIQSVFFNATLKLAALRIALLASGIVIGYLSTKILEISRNVGDAVIFVTLAVVFLHQLLSAFKLRFWVRLFDFLLLMAEVVMLSYITASFVPGRYASTSLILVFVSSVTLSAVLFFLLLCRFAAIVRGKGRTLFKPFDILEDEERSKGDAEPRWLEAYSILIGRSIWRTQFAGESLPVRLIRGFVAGAFLTALVAYGTLYFIVKPIQETAVIPVKESRGQSFAFSIAEFEEFGFNSWNFVFSMPTIVDRLNGTGIDSQNLFDQVVKVTPFWEGVNLRDANGNAVSPPNCTHVSDESQFAGGTFLRVNCPFIGFAFIPPDVLIEVNYDPLSIPANLHLTNVWKNTITVRVGFSNQTESLISGSEATRSREVPILANSHHVAEVSYELRKALKRPALSALGMFEQTVTFALAQILQIVPDPLTSSNPPVLNMSNNTSTFRLFYSQDNSEIRIIEDSREQSVLGGFSAVGGLWAFMGGIFAMLFGTSLMKIFFDAKELSIFGFAQQLERDKIVKEHLERYPKIREELDLPRSQRGIVALLQDYMIDVGLFGDAAKAGRREEDEADLHRHELELEKHAVRRGSDGDVEAMRPATTATTPGVEEVKEPTLSYRP